MAKAKPKPSTFNPKRLFVWGGLLLLGAGWFFLLGVLVGRGLVPLPIEADPLPETLASQLAEETAMAQARLRQGAQEGLPEEPLRIQDLRQPQVDTEVGPVPRTGAIGPDGLRLKKRRVPPKKRPLAKAARPSPGRAPEAGATAAQRPAPATATASATASAEKAGTPAARKSVAAALAGMTAKFTLQVASVRKQAAAEEIVKRLQKAGFSAYHTASPPGGNGVWYRVRVGAYETRQAAQAALGKFKGSRYKPIIIQR